MSRAAERGEARRAIVAIAVSVALMALGLGDMARGRAADRPRPPPRRVVFLAGADDDHPAGCHEYAKAAIVLADTLQRSDVGAQVDCEVHHDGWPADDAVIATADTIVLISAGADRRREDHPFLVGDRLGVIDRAMKRGCGLVVIHWGLFVPRNSPAAVPVLEQNGGQNVALEGGGLASPADRFAEWIGGHFDYESGPAPTRWASRIETGERVVEVVAPIWPEPCHPVLRGVGDTSVYDEFYDHLRFVELARQEELHLTPLLFTSKPEEPGMRSGSPPRKPSATLDDVIAFSVERPDGGRGVGFSGGHFLENYGPDRYQRFLLNAISWTAKVTVPEKGVEPPAAAKAQVLIVTGHDHPAHDWRGVTAAMQEVLALDPRFEVRVDETLDVNSFASITRSIEPKLAALILAWNQWDDPGPTDPTTRNAWITFVERGGGLVLPHFSGSAFQATLPAGPAADWPTFREHFSARWWRYPEPASGHDPFGPFRVELTAECHPITAGAAAWLAHDELYHSQAGTLPIAPLITAKSRQSGRYEPLAWAREVGRGRVFQSLLGHAPQSYRVPGTARLFARGVAWAAGLKPLALPGLEPERGSAATVARHVEGLRGRALDARVTHVELAGSPDAAARPGNSFTVECAARLFSKSNYNVLVTHQPHASAGHFDLDSRIGDGVFKAYLPGWEPSEIPSPRDIVDEQWHRLAMQFDTVFVPARDAASPVPTATVVLFVDGAEVLRTQVRWLGRSDVIDGPFVIGASYEGTTPRCGSDALLDEVIVQRGVAPITPIADPPSHGVATLAFEDFDTTREALAPADALVVPVVKEADRPWTPPPASGPDAPPWEKETDADWSDARFAAMDTGPFLMSSVRTPPETGRERVAKGVTVKLGQNGEVSWLFDTERCEFVAAWEGGLKFEPARFGLLSAPTIPGRPLLTTCLLDAPSATKPAANVSTVRSDSKASRSFLGLWRHGDRVVLEYEIDGVHVFESPRAVLPDESGLAQPLLMREFEVGPCLLDLASSLGVPTQRGPQTTSLADGESLTQGWSSATSATDRPRSIRVFLYRGPDADLQKLADYVSAHEADPIDVAALASSGPALFGAPIVTRGVVAENDTAYVVDSLEPPFTNRWNALLYFSGIDFLPDGRAAVCTAHGDVWLVGGIDATLEHVTWQRFASGLHQPLGLKVVASKVLVTCRDGITRLHDEDGDGEADFYEAFQHDIVETGGDHLFAMNLEQAPDGGLFFVKSGDSGTPHGGALLRASADGATLTRFATGWRHGNGLAISSRGEIVTSDNQGNWVPSTRLDLVREGGFHGYVPAWRGKEDLAQRPDDARGATQNDLPDASPPPMSDPPLCWIPHEVDNSAGSPVFCERRDFGPLSHQLLHLSFGKARLYFVLRDDDRAAGVVPLPIEFLSGSMRGEFSPGDGALYVVGCDGWQTAAVRDGCLQRVRYTGRAFHLPTELRVRSGWISLVLPEPLDRAIATRADRYTLARWNYRSTADYGSAKYRPDKGNGRSEVGEEPLAITRVELAPDGCRLFLFVNDLQPVDQMRLTFDLVAEDGVSVRGAIYPTVNSPAK